MISTTRSACRRFLSGAFEYQPDALPFVPFRQAAHQTIKQSCATSPLERTETRFGMKPASLTADSAYGSADSLAWLVKQKGITPLIPAKA